MRLQFGKADFSYMVDSIQAFLGKENGTFFSETIYHFYPVIEKEMIAKLSESEKRKYIQEQLCEIEQNVCDEISEKLISYQQYWEDNKQTIIPSLEQIFEVSLEDKLNDMTARIGLNPICPRHLETHSFDVFYLSSPVGAIETALHEIVHFVWFIVWQGLFQDNIEEYDTPHLKWIFSEMAVHPILKEQTIAKYTLYEKPAYEYFYQIEADGNSFMERLNQLYQDTSIKEFMKQGYELCQAYEAEIRSVMY